MTGPPRPIPAWLWEREHADLMRVGDHILNCAVAVGQQADDGEFVPHGTGFIVSITEKSLLFPYLVTAKHVVDGIRSSRITVRANTQHGKVKMQDLPRGKGFEFNHPAHCKPNYIDVSVFDFPLSDFNLTHLEPADFCDEETMRVENIGIGDEVVTIGMFYKVLGVEVHSPIVRVGNIAAMPSEPVPTKHGFVDAVLVETRSIYGLSGSPVLLHMGLRPPVQRHGPLSTTKRSHFLLGMMHGFYAVRDLSEVAEEVQVSGDEFLNSGIAVVVPADKIYEVLFSPDLVEIRRTRAEFYFRRSETHG